MSRSGICQNLINITCEYMVASNLLLKFFNIGCWPVEAVESFVRNAENFNQGRRLFLYDKSKSVWLGNIKQILKIIAMDQFVVYFFCLGLNKQIYTNEMDTSNGDNGTGLEMGSEIENINFTCECVCKEEIEFLKLEICLTFRVSHFLCLMCPHVL